MTVCEDPQKVMQKRLDDCMDEIEQLKAGTGKNETDTRVNYDKGLVFLHARKERSTDLVPEEVLMGLLARQPRYSRMCYEG